MFLKRKVSKDVTKRAKVIIGAIIALLLGGAVAGIFATNGFNPAKSSNQIKADIEKAFEGKDYFEEVIVQSYSGLNEESDADKAGKSASVRISLSKMDAETFKEAASLLPDLNMTAFYSIGDTADVENITSATGFKNEDFKNTEIVEAIAASLKVQDSYKGSYWQISLGNAEGNDAEKLKTQFVAKDNTVTEIRKTVDAVLTPKMDVLPVTKTDLSTGSFSQFAAVDGKMENYDAGLEIGLKFADAVFLDSEKVALLGLGDDIQISYTSLREGLDYAKVTEIAKELNKDQLFKITVVDPNATPETEGTEQSAPTESAKPSESASSQAEPTPVPSESGK